MRRHLHFSIDEWDRLPWWQQQVYIEELDAELSGGNEPQQSGMSSDDSLLAHGFQIQ
ncbi:hypothetical protein [Saccharopolyspora sp. NPDC002376]